MPTIAPLGPIATLALVATTAVAEQAETLPPTDDREEANRGQSHAAEGILQWDMERRRGVCSPPPAAMARPRERLRFHSETVWLSETIWQVNERMEFDSGRVIVRKMFAELVAPDHIRLTADDMPGGAGIHLHAEGFRFTPYYILAASRDGGILHRLRCLDECLLDEEGFVHDTIRMYYCGVRVATMRIGPITRSGEAQAGPLLVPSTAI